MPQSFQHGSDDNFHVPMITNRMFIPQQELIHSVSVVSPVVSVLVCNPGVCCSCRNGLAGVVVTTETVLIV